MSWPTVAGLGAGALAAPDAPDAPEMGRRRAGAAGVPEPDCAGREKGRTDGVADLSGTVDGLAGWVWATGVAMAAGLGCS